MIYYFDIVDVVKPVLLGDFYLVLRKNNGTGCNSPGYLVAKSGVRWQDWNWCQKLGRFVMRIVGLWWDQNPTKKASPGFR